MSHILHIFSGLTDLWGEVTFSYRSLLVGKSQTNVEEFRRHGYNYTHFIIWNIVVMVKSLSSLCWPTSSLCGCTSTQVLSLAMIVQLCVAHWCSLESALYSQGQQPSNQGQVHCNISQSVMAPVTTVTKTIVDWYIWDYFNVLWPNQVFFMPKHRQILLVNNTICCRYCCYYYS